MKKVIKPAAGLLAAAILAAAALLVWLTVCEYRPGPVETLAVYGEAAGAAAPGSELRLITFNVGYCGLGAESDFFMDGGSQVHPPDRDTVRGNLHGIQDIIAENEADVYFFQEVDRNSRRSGGSDQALSLAKSGYGWSHALNYSCPFVPYPLPPIGRVESGIMTMTSLGVTRAERISLPSPFSWPVSTANLKRCLLVTRLPAGEGELVLINLHLEAYDGDGSGRQAQLEQLLELCAAEYENGSYVIAGGDFNSSFPGVVPELFPIVSDENYLPGELDISGMGEGWQLAFDGGTPSCRLLDRPYDAAAADNQYYIIDGFLLSPNVELLSVQTIDQGFAFSDHNPVSLRVRLAAAPEEGG